MALEERDREDLLRDARMMPQRAECVVGGVTIVVGFRRQGQLSLYCGSDPVFQFNVSGELRRAFFQGRRFAAENGYLVELGRETRGGQVKFESQKLDADTQASIVSSASHWLKDVRNAIGCEQANWQVVEPVDQPFFESLTDWFERVPAVAKIADRPNA